MPDSSRYITPVVQAFDTAGLSVPGGKLFFFISGTSTPQNTYSDEARTTANANPVVADGDGNFGNIFLEDADYKVQYKNADESIQYWERDPVGPPSADSVFYDPPFTDSVPRSIESRLSDFVSVFDFMTDAEKSDVSSGTGALDVTTAVQNAIDFVKGEANPNLLVYPAGRYNVSTLDYIGASNTIHFALGNVQIFGSGTETSIIDIDGGTDVDPPMTPTVNIQFIGGFSVQVSGGTYSYGIYMSRLSNSRIKMTLSGDYSVNTGYINFSFDNPRLEFVVSNDSGTAIATFECGTNNVNSNHFYMRTTGAADLGIASTGMIVRGASNKVEGDFSSSQNGIEVIAATGTVLSPCYFETNINSIVLSEIARGTVIEGGIYQAGQDGAAIKFINAENTTILGGRIRGTAASTNRTAYDFGTLATGVTLQNVSVDSTTIDQAYLGTPRGAGNFPDTIQRVDVNWINFAPTDVQSTLANTMDDFERGTWTPTNSNISFSAAEGYYVKIANMVAAFFKVNFPVTADGSAADINNFPFSANDIASQMNGLGVGANNSSVPIGGILAANQMIFRQNGTGTTSATNANLSGNFITGTMVYSTTGI